MKRTLATVDKEIRKAETQLATLRSERLHHPDNVKRRRDELEAQLPPWMFQKLVLDAANDPDSRYGELMSMECGLLDDDDEDTWSIHLIFDRFTASEEFDLDDDDLRARATLLQKTFESEKELWDYFATSTVAMELGLPALIMGIAFAAWLARKDPFSEDTTIRGVWNDVWHAKKEEKEKKEEEEEKEDEKGQTE